MRAVPETAVQKTDWRMVLLAVMALAGTGMLVLLLNLQTTTDRERDAALERQAHTYEVIIRAGQVSTASAEAEAMLGRYITSGDAAVGRQFSDRWSRASDRLRQLETQLRDQPQQAVRAARLRDAFQTRSNELAQTVGYMVHDRGRDALGSYYQLSATAARTGIERLLNQIVTTERQRLLARKDRSAILLARSHLATNILGLFGLLVVTGAILLGWLTVQAAAGRDEAETDADAERVRADELQQAVEAATAQLRQEMREREQTEAQLRQAQKMEAVGQLTGGIAHDFNNMLAVVLGGLELAKRHLHTGGNDANKHIENAMEGANRAAALTRRLLAFSREEVLLPAAIEPRTVIAGMSELFDRTLGDAIEVTTSDADLGWRIFVDKHQLENALLNLAVNARDAMNGRGALRFHTDGCRLEDHAVGECAAGDYASIAVTDTGGGMTPEVLERVFEPFFTTKPVGKGTGLGLSQIFGFVRQSGGEIAIDTTPGEGTTVTLYLPRHEGEITPEAPQDEATGTEDAEVTLDIMVVEDDPRVLSATMSALSALGHRPVACEDPLAAEACLDRMDHVDLILTDVLMPGRTGPEMIAALSSRVDGIAVLYVTGFAGEADADAFGGHSVLRKPFTMAALAKAVVAAVRRG
ncbi:ATP-binding protein [Sphingomonas sp. HF-S3]|uniref:histidine kinase n=1 Tax=Sphingomonas rustica TaxID=3103142 RepID=A0ABV0B6K9_9SPHN